MKIKDIPWYDRPGFRLSRESVEKLSNPLAGYGKVYILF